MFLLRDTIIAHFGVKNATFILQGDKSPCPGVQESADDIAEVFREIVSVKCLLQESMLLHPVTFTVRMMRMTISVGNMCLRFPVGTFAAYLFSLLLQHSFDAKIGSWWCVSH